MLNTATGKLIKGIIITLACVELLNLLLGRSLTQFGIYPREWFGLLGIIASPFIHGSLGHFFANIIPLCVFTFLLMQLNRHHYWLITIFLILTTGILVWLFARSSHHVGASGLIYGYFGYLLIAGFTSKRLLPIISSVFIALFYGGMIFGVLPLQAYVSWESHLFGLIMGIIAARVFPMKIQSSA